MSESSDQPVIDLSIEPIIQEARTSTGLDDFGEASFREGLATLLETYDTTADLTPRGRKRARRRMHQLLCTRLRIEEAFKRHPEIRERSIRRPVYLTGLPRTGTSALFNLLGADPATRPLLLWEASFPDPLEEADPNQPDPRFIMMREGLAMAQEKNPEFSKIHVARADGPEECVLLMSHTFADAQLGVEPLMEPYASWFQAQDLSGMYAYYADLLRMLDWQRPGDRWLLKSPAHLWALDVLTKMFPDACILWTHRNPLQILPSYCSMMAALMDQRQSLDPHQLGATVLEFLACSLERAMAARKVADASRFYDIDYKAFIADPLTTVRGVYDHFDLPMQPETEAALQQQVQENPQNKHGAHRYLLEEFGLTPTVVRDRLADYIEHFGVSADG